MRSALPAAALLAAAACLRTGSTPEPIPKSAERLTARTADGWNIALVRYRPRGQSAGPPVLLCHGISANARNLDLDEAHSMARWLAARGREAFTMSLRGTGESDLPDPASRRSPDYSIDTFAQQDLPAAIAKVLEVSGASQVDFVGHSMGGMVAYIYLARGGRAIRALATLGSPARFVMGGSVEGLLRRASAFAPAAPFVDAPGLARASLPVLTAGDTLLDLFMYNPNNLSPETWRTLLAAGVGSISGGVLRHFARILERDGLVSEDGAVDYRPLLGAAKTPALVVAGKLDRIAPAPSVKVGYDLLGGEKSFFIAGEENGFLFDYGHMDLILGDRAGRELWPRVLEFLAGAGGAALPAREPAPPGGRSASER